MERLRCTHCGSDAKRTLTDGGAHTFPICDTCFGGLVDAKSAMGRVLRRWAKHAIRRIATRQHADYMATPEYLANAREAMRRARLKPGIRLKVLARTALRNAMLRGEIKRPEACQRCGDIPEFVERTGSSKGQCQIWFHHTHGYEQEFWLIGEWLCKHCHMISEPSTRRGVKLGPRPPKELP